MELDASGEGKDNDSNLFVRFLGQVARRITFCLISIKRWDEMPEDNTTRKCLQNKRKCGKLTISHAGRNKSNARRASDMEKIIEYLLKDQERAEGIPSKVLAHPNDAIEKIYGPENGKRVRSFSSVVSPVSFGKSKRIFEVARCGSSCNSMLKIYRSNLNNLKIKWQLSTNFYLKNMEMKYLLSVMMCHTLSYIFNLKSC
ncbi:hypothetical protein PIB30_036118 [Stylosanthes scabra]|uniref:Uncharacterized protein n=1 Tax=Stylosanthes scabra TaxID=79078 RepID=A0ABU6VBB0_9FABA|nr:hypothetical protein [Stylosanthes scabra]